VRRVYQQHLVRVRGETELGYGGKSAPRCPSHHPRRTEARVSGHLHRTCGQFSPKEKFLSQVTEALGHRDVCRWEAFGIGGPCRKSRKEKGQDYSKGRFELLNYDQIKRRPLCTGKGEYILKTCAGRWRWYQGNEGVCDSLDRGRHRSICPRLTDRVVVGDPLSKGCSATR